MAYLDGLPKEAKKGTLLGKGFNEGRVAMDKKKWDDAIGIFRKLLPEAESSQKGALLNLIGICFYSQSKLDQALGHYKESLKLAEEIQDKDGIVFNLNNMGIVYAHKGDYDTAIRDFTRAIEIDPNNATTFYNRGLAYVEKKDYVAAIRDFTKAIKLNPNNAFAFNNRGNAYASNKDYDAAIRDYNKAIELVPNFAMAFNNRGLAHRHNKNYDAAIQDYTEAIKLDLNLAMTMANMGIAYEIKGDKENARLWWEKALEKKEYLPPGVEERVKRWIKELEE